MFRFKNKKGFTILELLVVIVIVALLAGLAFAILSGSRNKAKDLKRITEVSDIGKALGFYFIDTGAYPEAITGGEAIVNPDTGYVYLAEVPIASTTEDVLGCLFTGYEYTRIDNGGAYFINYCLGEEVDGAGPGNITYTPDSIEAYENTCIGKECGTITSGAVCGTCDLGSGCYNYLCDLYGGIDATVNNGLYWAMSDIGTSLTWGPTGSVDGSPVWNASTGLYDYPAGYYHPENYVKSDFPAFEYCEDLGGDSHWRLPTKAELYAFSNEGGGDGELPGTLQNTHWSSTSTVSGYYVSISTYDFGYNMYRYPMSTQGSAYSVMCVHE